MSEADGVLCSEEYEDEQSPEKIIAVSYTHLDGSHIVFNGMNPEIELREHQKNAVAHILYLSLIHI